MPPSLIDRIGSSLSSLIRPILRAFDMSTPPTPHISNLFEFPTSRSISDWTELLLDHYSSTESRSDASRERMRQLTVSRLLWYRYATALEYEFVVVEIEDGQHYGRKRYVRLERQGDPENAAALAPTPTDVASSVPSTHSASPATASTIVPSDSDSSTSTVSPVSPVTSTSTAGHQSSLPRMHFPFEGVKALKALPAYGKLVSAITYNQSVTVPPPTLLDLALATKATHDVAERYERLHHEPCSWFACVLIHVVTEGQLAPAETVGPSETRAVCCWNENIKSSGAGHYGIASIYHEKKEDIEEALDEYYNVRRVAMQKIAAGAAHLRDVDRIAEAERMACEEAESRIEAAERRTEAAEAEIARRLRVSREPGPGKLQSGGLERT